MSNPGTRLMLFAATTSLLVSFGTLPVAAGEVDEDLSACSASEGAFASLQADGEATGGDAAWGTVCSAGDQVLQDVLGMTLECTDHQGKKDVFQIIEGPTEGENFRIWILQGLASGDVRIGWNAQIPRTYEGVNTYLTYQVPHHNFGTVPVTDNRAFGNGITGFCGVYAGTPQGSTFDVKVDFMGQDITITKTNGQSVGFSVTVSASATFSVKPWKLASVTVSASVTGSFEYWSETTTTLQGYLKTFEQKGYSNGPLLAENVGAMVRA